MGDAGTCSSRCGQGGKGPHWEGEMPWAALARTGAAPILQALRGTHALMSATALQVGCSVLQNLGDPWWVVRGLGLAPQTWGERPAVPCWSPVPARWPCDKAQQQLWQPAEGTGWDSAPTGLRPGQWKRRKGFERGCLRQRSDPGGSGHRKEAQSQCRQAAKADDRATLESPGATCPR